ncbi:MAG TPA: rhodanese-like domain-containing protein [Gammaproteobacteria bacterium]|nr:rhodanese-like domain-containing protein [Gammaproteobacteria bacterium]
MEQYLEFASRHVFLVGGFFLVAGLLIYSYIAPRFRAWKTISPLDATQLINREDALVLDVREDNEYQGGHIVNSVHIPLSLIDKRMGELEKYRGRPIIVGCRSGSRSGHVCSLLSKQGFENVYNLGGGVMAWESASLPLSKR